MIQLDKNPVKVSHDNPFSGKWEKILTNVGKAFNLSEEELTRIGNSRIPQLIAAIPFIAGCEDTIRTACSHLATYLLTVRTKKIFDPKPSDDEDIFRRLKMIDNYIGGDRSIIERGANLLALNMICDYNRDTDEDKKLGKYNPVSSGKLDFNAQKADLNAEIAGTESRYMDEILTPGEAEKGFWNEAE